MPISLIYCLIYLLKYFTIFNFILLFLFIFYSHTTKTTQWEDPRIQFRQQRAISERIKPNGTLFLNYLIYLFNYKLDCLNRLVNFLVVYEH